MRLQDEVAGQEAPHLRIPVHAAATDAVRRHERAPAAHRQSLLVEFVAHRKSQLIRPQEELVSNAVAKLVLHLTWRKVGRSVPPGTALEGEHVESLVGQLMCHQRTGPTETDDDDVFPGKY